MLASNDFACHWGGIANRMESNGMTIGMEKIRAEREVKEATAKAIADTLPVSDYYASGNEVVNRETGQRTVCGETHWDAVLVMLETAR